MNNFKKVQYLLQKNVVDDEISNNIKKTDNEEIEKDTSDNLIGANENIRSTNKEINSNNETNSNKERSKGKAKFVDDGRSIADLNIEGFSWYIPKRLKREKTELANLNISKKERKAMILGAFSAILPVAGFIIVMYAGAFLLLSMWLK